MSKNIKQEVLEILLIEDDPDEVMVVKKSLNKTAEIKIKLKIVSSILKAIFLLKRNNFDLILFDLSVFDGNGLSSLEKLLNNNKATPVVVLTVNKNKVLRKNAIESGAHDCIVKGELTEERLFPAIQYSLMCKKLNNQILENNKNTHLVNKIKDDFIMMTNHEFNGPISAISMATEVLKGEMLGPLNMKYKKYANMIQNSADHLLQLSNKMVELTSLESGELVIKHERFNIKEMVDSICLIQQPKAKKMNITLDMNTKSVVNVIVDADPVCIEKVITKLVEAAFRLAESKVRLGINIKQKKLCLVVENNGSGIMVKDFSKLLDKFDINENYDKKQIWLILDLVIVKGIIDAHGGSIKVENCYDTNSNINGLRFEMKLPRI